jgi:hypothetical protein
MKGDVTGEGITIVVLHGAYVGFHGNHKKRIIQVRRCTKDKYLKILRGDV